jgi:putative Flp pilus-assembly TadE/G-like protein
VRYRRGDAGSVTVLVAVVLGFGVLTGMCAVVVDVGRLYAEREQLQSGADAAALAVAQMCAATPTSCASGANQLAGRYANDNAKDSASSVAPPCGRGPGLTACPPPQAGLKTCIGSAPGTGSYVEVRTSTRMSNGSTLLPPSFAQAMLNNSAYQGHTVAACARAAWGPPSGAAGPAFTFSQCEWNIATNNRVSFEPAPAYGPASPLGQIALNMHDNKGNPSCPAGPSVWDRPGGFGWLDENVGACQTSIAINGTYGGDTGNSVSGGCKTMLPTWRANRQCC